MLYFFLCNCSVSKKFIDTKKENAIRKLNLDIAGKKVQIYKNNGDLLAVSNSLLITQDSLFYTENYSTSVSLSDLGYLKIPPKNPELRLLPGFTLFATGLIYGRSGSENVSLGEALGRAYNGFLLMSIGVVATTIGIISNRSNYYYFQEEVNLNQRSTNKPPCRNPRSRRRC